MLLESNLPRVRLGLEGILENKCRVGTKIRDSNQ